MLSYESKENHRSFLATCHMKQGQRHRTFHFFEMAKGTQGTRGNGTHKTGDTRKTTGHREHKGHRGYKGHGTHETGDTRDTGNIRDTKDTGDTRGHRATSSPGRFSLPYRPKKWQKETRVHWSMFYPVHFYILFTSPLSQG